VASVPHQRPAPRADAIPGAAPGGQARGAEAEAALRDLARSQAAAHLGHWRWDLGADTVTWSEELYRVFGVEPGTFLPTHAAANALLHPDDRAPHAAAVAAALRGEVVPPFEARIIRPGGEARVVLATAFEVERDAAGRPRQLFGAVLDVTDRKRVEEALRAREAEAQARAEELDASRGELRALASRLDLVREEEQARFATDLHDDMGQLLTGIKMSLQVIERRAGELQPPSTELLERAVDTVELVDRAIASVRRIAAALRPGLLDQLGLEAALRQELRALEARTGLSCALALSGPAPALRAEQATALFRIAQEALTNVVRHAGARRVTVRLATAAGAVRLEVEDDGRGLGERAAGAVTLGLAGMRERARRLGGELALGPGPAGGTLVSTTIPA